MRQRCMIASTQRFCTAKSCSYHSGLNQRCRKKRYDETEVYRLLRSPYYRPSSPYSCTIPINRLWLEIFRDHGTLHLIGNSRCPNKVSGNHQPRHSIAPRVIQQHPRPLRKSRFGGKRMENFQRIMFALLSASLRISTVVGKSTESQILR